MIDRSDNFDISRENTEDMLVDAFCKLDDFARRMMDRQRSVIELLRRLHRCVMKAEDSKSAADDLLGIDMTADRIILDALLTACHETFDAMDDLWKEEQA